jgi:flagellar motor switch protein FliN
MSAENAVADDSISIQKIKLAELDAGAEKGRKLVGSNLDLIRNVKVRLSVSAGSSELTVKELFELKENAILALNKEVREPVDVMLDGKVIARGQLVAVGEHFGVQISEISV